jgi:hypothetical protein
LINWFKSKPPAKAGPSPRIQPTVDEDETIVVDLMGDQPPASRHIRLEFEQPAPTAAPPRPAPDPAGRMEPALSHPDDRTEIVTVGDLNRATGAVTAPAPSPAPAQALVPGWLCVISGPGRGVSHPIRMGRSKVGRSANNQVVLAVGDETISAEAHVTIAADPKTQRFYAVPGDSTNLAYVDGMPLLDVREIQDGAKLQLGLTELVFIQCFGNYVDWS